MEGACASGRGVEGLIVVGMDGVGGVCSGVIWLFSTSVVVTRLSSASSVLLLVIPASSPASSSHVQVVIIESVRRRSAPWTNLP